MKTAEKHHRLLTNLVWKQEHGRLRKSSSLLEIAQKLAGDPYAENTCRHYLFVLARYGEVGGWDFEWKSPGHYNAMKRFDETEEGGKRVYHELFVQAARIAYLHSTKLERLLNLLIIKHKSGAFKDGPYLREMARRLSAGPYPPYAEGTCHEYLLLLAKRGAAEGWDFEAKSNTYYNTLKSFEEIRKNGRLVNHALVEKAARIAYFHWSKLERLLNLTIKKERAGVFRDARGLKDLARVLGTGPYSPFSINSCHICLIVLANYWGARGWDFELTANQCAAIKKFDKASSDNHALVEKAARIAYKHMNRLERFLNQLVSKEAAGELKRTPNLLAISKELSKARGSYHQGVCNNYLRALATYGSIGSWDFEGSYGKAQQSLRNFDEASPANHELVVEVANIVKNYKTNSG